MLGEVATALEERFDGGVPEEEFALRSLPGVGDGVAQAVRCFRASGAEQVLLDVTTARLTERYSAGQVGAAGRPGSTCTGLPGAQGPDAAFNSALLDLGALDLSRPDDPAMRRRVRSGPACAARGVHGTSQLAT